MTTVHLRRPPAVQRPAGPASSVGIGPGVGRRAGAAVALLAMALLWGCATAPSERPDTGAEPAELPAVQADPHAAYEGQLRQRALTATRQRRWGEAALNWELLTLLRPG